jgi:hypothetical protein
MKNKYLEHRIILSDNQRKNLFNAIKNKKPISIKLSNTSLNGDFPVLLTASQKNNIDKAIKNNNGIILNLSVTQLQKLTKHGGFLPFLPLILGGLSAIGTMGAAGAQIAKAINQAKANENQLQETKRHNEIIESKLFSGKGLYKQCNKCKGRGLFLGRNPYTN